MSCTKLRKQDRQEKRFRSFSNLASDQGCKVRINDLYINLFIQCWNGATVLGKYINISLPSARLSKQPPAVLKSPLHNNDNYHSMRFSSLSISRESITWPANNCLQIMVCSCIVASKCGLLQIIFCSCAIGTRFSRKKNGRSLPWAARKWLK